MSDRVKGKIIKSIAGFYEVHTPEAVYRCRAKGIFRALGKKPLVGDDVEIDITDTVSVPMEGNVRALFPRKNELVRPNVANVDQALLLFAITHPAPSYNMLDRFLITMQERKLDAILCFNKKDIASPEEISELRQTYEACGCTVLFISSYIPESLEDHGSDRSQRRRKVDSDQCPVPRCEHADRRAQPLDPEGQKYHPPCGTAGSRRRHLPC